MDAISVRRGCICITLYSDNQGALSLAENLTFHRSSKHIAVRYHLVRQEAEEDRLQLAYILTDHMPANRLTKALKTPAHKVHTTPDASEGSVKREFKVFST